MKSQTLRSDILGESRNLWIHESRSINRDEPVHLLLWFDGQSLPEFKASLETLDATESRSPLVIIGIECGRTRSKDYCPDADPTGFAAHEQFVTDEVIEWAKQFWNITSDGTAIGGFSNGALAALWIGLRHRNQFGTIIAFSPPGGSDRFNELVEAADSLPTVYLAAGNRETPFRKTVEGLTKKLKAQNANVQSAIRPNRSHEMALWSEELPNAIMWWLVQDEQRTDAKDPN